MIRGNELIDALRGLFESCQAFDTRRYEDCPSSGEIFVELVPPIQDELDGALSLLGIILDHYEPLAEGKDACEAAAVETMDESVARRVADLTFVARIELMQQRERLMALSSDTDPWEAISVCASTRRRVLKSVTALERAICECEDIELDGGLYPSGLERSLQVRHAYGRFRKAIVQGGEPDEDGIRDRLRLASVEIGVIVQGKVYEDLRVEDRRQFRTFGVQIDEWLEKGDEGHAREGSVLYQDLVSFAQLLTQVNNRADLQEHDNQVLSEIYRDLFGKGAAPSLQPEALHRIKALYGRDDELDHLMDYAENSPAELWRTPLARMMSGSTSGAEGGGAAVSTADSSTSL